MDLKITTAAALLALAGCASNPNAVDASKAAWDNDTQDGRLELCLPKVGSKDDSACFAVPDVGSAT
jgi:hypothetical protein